MQFIQCFFNNKQQAYSMNKRQQQKGQLRDAFPNNNIKSVVSGGAADDYGHLMIDDRLRAIFGDRLRPVHDASLINVSQERAAKVFGTRATLTVAKDAAAYNHALLSKISSEPPMLVSPQRQQQKGQLRDAFPNNMVMRVPLPTQPAPFVIMVCFRRKAFV